MFRLLDLDLENSFERASNNVCFENITKGRKGAILVPEEKFIPIVRTTTRYEEPVQKFNEFHAELLQKLSEEKLKFNNAMIEIYQDSYRKMGYHSDQNLDLEPDSFICLFSCYEKEPFYPRKLKVKSKENTDEKAQEILLTNNSAVIFSLETNDKHKHKIMLDSKTDTKWLGITLRLSKTLIDYKGDIPMINGVPLVLANEKQEKEFFSCRKKENKEIGYKYPEINYTISKSDLIPPSFQTN